MDQQQQIFYKFIEFEHRIQILQTQSQSLSKWTEVENFLSQVYQLKSQEKFQSLYTALQQMKQVETFSQVVQEMFLRAIQMLKSKPQIKILIHHDQISLSRFEIYSLMSLVFFGLTAKQDTYKFHTQINMKSLLQIGQVEKVKCLLQYFIQGLNYRLDEQVIIKKNQIKQQINWLKSDSELIETKFQLGKNEDNHNCAVVDFSDTLFSGKTLSQQGCAQEEIILLIYPEAITASLLCSSIQDDQAIIIQNVIRYSNYSGYEDSFKFIPRVAINYQQDIVAIDAIYFATKQLNYQFTQAAIERELNKAFIGFEGTTKPISTGKWGCGVYGGHKELKCLLQWISASQAQRKIHFNCLEDKAMMNLQVKFNSLKQKYKTVGKIVSALFNIKNAKELPGL